MLPDDGVMMLHTICGVSMEYARANGVPLTMELARFVKFIMTEIFPGGQLPRSRPRGAPSRPASPSPHAVASAALRGPWTSGPRRSRRPRDEAIAVQSEEVDRDRGYLSGCAGLFRKGYVDVNQFTLTK